MPVPTQEQSAAKEATAKRQDLLWPHYTRIVAAVMVVVIHSVAGTVGGTAPGSRMWWGATLLDSAASWAVPVFVMMSGALVLGSPRWSGAASFYRRRLVKIGIPAVAWIAIYIAFRGLYLHQEFGVRQAAKLTLAGYPYVHLFYLFVIFGLYAVAPGLRILIEHISRGQLVAITAIWLSLGWFNEFIGPALDVPTANNAVTFFIPYVGYFLAGYVLRDAVVRGLRAWLLVVGIALLIVGEAATAYALDTLAPLNKFSALTIPMSIMAFIVLLQVGRVAERRGFTGRLAAGLSSAAFGVYLIHLIVLSVFTDRAGIDITPATPGGLALALAGTVVASWAIILVVQRIPLLKRIV
ncbi:MAG: acyltransferase [Mycobacteriales bacterium]